MRIIKSRKPHQSNKEKKEKVHGVHGFPRTFDENFLGKFRNNTLFQFLNILNYI